MYTDVQELRSGAAEELRLLLVGRPAGLHGRGYCGHNGDWLILGGALVVVAVVVGAGVAIGGR